MKSPATKTYINAINIIAVLMRFFPCLWFSFAFGSNSARADATYPFNYEGRFTQPNGAPVPGPVALRIDFFHSSPTAVGAPGPVLSITNGLESVALADGIFSVRLEIAAADYNVVFSAASQAVYVRVTDLAHPNSPYPPQLLGMVPAAAKVPVDQQTVSFNSNGELTVGPSTAPGPNQFLSKDAQGNMIWATPSTTATAIQGQTVSLTAPSSGQILTYTGGQWVPTTPATGSSGVSTVSASAPLAVTNASTTPQLSIAQATSISDGYLTSSDWITFKSSLPQGGGTMSGTLNMGGAALTNLAVPVNASDAATKAYVDAATSGAGAAATVFGTGDNTASPGAGQLRGPAGIGANTVGAPLNLTASNGTGTGGSGALNFQTATAGGAGSAPDTLTTRMTITSTGNIGLGTTAPGSILDIKGALTERGINVPTISTAGQGVIYFDSASAQFQVSQNGSAYAPLIAGGTVTSVVGGTGLSGTVTTSGTLSLATVGTAGTYAKVITDVYGRVTGSTPLVAGDLPAISATAVTAGTLAVAYGGTGVTSFTNNGVVIGSGTALTATAAGSQFNVLTVNGSNQPTFGAINLASGAAVTGVLPVANGGTGITGTPTVGQIPVGNGAGFTLTVLGQGPTLGVTLTNSAGSISLDTAQDIRPSASPNFAGIEISGLSSTLIKANASGKLVPAAASDLTALLGFTPLNKAGDTVTGGLGVAGALAANSVNASGSLTAGTVLSQGSVTSQGNVIVQGNGTNANKLVLNDRGATNYLAIKSPDVLVNSVTFTLPMGDGTGGQVLATNGSGSLSWASGLAPTGVAGGDLAGSFPNPTLAAIGTAGTYTKVMTDSKGRVTGSASLSAADIPALSASAITSGTLLLAAIPSLPATAITSGTLNAAVLPSLAASYVAVNGSTMAGALVLPANGLSAGTNQFVLANGNVGIGSVSPAGKLDISGTICLNGTNCISARPGGGTTAVTTVTAGPGLVGGPITSTGSLSLQTVSTAGTYTKVTADAFGRVIGASSLLATDLPPLAASAITTGSFAVAQIPALPASIITSGSFGVAQIPSLPASVITSGSFGVAQIPSLPASIINSGSFGVAQIPSLPASIINSGSFGVAQIPSLPASIINSGSFGVAQIPSLPASIINSGSFGVAQIPSLPASIINSGSFGVAQIPNLPASIIASGSFGVAQIPSLPASIITSGTLALATTPSLPASILSSGTLNIAQLPNFSAALITSGTLSSAVLPSLAGSYVGVAGSTMTGMLNLPLNGLVTGSNQLVLASGNVGIGTSFPANILDVNAGYSDGIKVGIAGGQESLYNLLIGPVNAGGGTIDWQMRITDFSGGVHTPLFFKGQTGNIGIGTTAPVAPLQVGSDSGSGTAIGSLVVATYLPGQSRDFKMGYDINSNFIMGDYGNVSSHATWTPSIAIPWSTGNVGIGTTSPGAKLAVAGTAGTDGIQFPDGTLQTTASTSNTSGMVTQSAGSVSITAASLTYQDTGTAITLPSSGTYMVRADVRCAFLSTSTSSLSYMTGELYNATSASAVANSARILGAVATGSNYQNTVSINTIITVTAASSIHLYVYWDGALSSPQIISNADGYTVLSYVKLSN